MRTIRTETTSQAFEHAVLDDCPFCSIKPALQRALVSTLPTLVGIYQTWLQYEPRTTSDLLDKVFPTACRRARQEWLLEALGDVLWGEGYIPENPMSPDPMWTWGGALVEAEPEEECHW